MKDVFSDNGAGALHAGSQGNCFIAFSAPCLFSVHEERDFKNSF